MEQTAMKLFQYSRRRLVLCEAQ